MTCPFGNTFHVYELAAPSPIDEPLPVLAQRHLGWDAGMAGEAEPEYRIVLERLEALVGGAHPDAAAARHDLGEVLVELGRGDEARPLLARALEGDGADFDADHPDVVALKARLAGDLAPLAPGQGHRPRSTHRKGRGSRRSKVPPASSGVPEAPRP